METPSITTTTAPSVDIKKLRYILETLPQSQLSQEPIDFSEFASQHFGPTVCLTQEPKSHKTKRHSKRLYNDVQRNSANFGVSAQEMIEYHDQRKRESLILKEQLKERLKNQAQGKQQAKFTLEPTRLESVASGKEVENQDECIVRTLNNHCQSLPKPRSKPPNVSLPPSPVDPNISSLGNTPYVTANTTPNRTANGTPVGKQKTDNTFVNSPGNPQGKFVSSDQTPPRPKTNPPELGLEKMREKSRKKSLGSPARVQSQLIPKVKPYIQQSGLESFPSSTSISSKVGILRRSSLSNISRKSSGNNLNNASKFKLSSPGLRRKNSQNSIMSTGSTSRPASGSIPNQRECHSIEDTLQADADFNDYSIPRRSSIQMKDNVFSFEDPITRVSNSESPIKKPDKTPRSPFFNEVNFARYGNYHPHSPRLRKRHSVAEIPGAHILSEKLQAPRNKRCLSSYGSLGTSPTKLYQRSPHKSSVPDLKASPIGKIFEDEVSEFQSN